MSTVDTGSKQIAVREYKNATTSATVQQLNRPLSSSSSPQTRNDRPELIKKHAQSINQDQTEILYLNARSIRNKRTMLNAYLKCSTYELIFITETWLAETDLSSIFFDTKDFCVLRNDRETHAGGVAALYSSKIADKIVTIDIEKVNGFEIIAFDFYVSTRECITFICVYLPPVSSKDLLIVSQLIEVLKQFMPKNQVYVIGDFNFGNYKWDHSVPTKKASLNRFLLFLEKYSLSQLITSPTHIDGNTLDLVIASTPENILNIELLEPLTVTCDHQMIKLSIRSTTSNKIPRQNNFNFYLADYNKINQYLSSINWEDIFSFSNNIEDMYNDFLEVIHMSIELYTPETKIYSKPKMPKEIRTMLKEKQRLYKISKYDSNAKVAYREIAKKYKKSIRAHKYQQEQRVVNSRNNKSLHNFIKNKLHTRHQIPPLLQSNNQVTLDALTKSNLLNNTFAKVFLKDEAGSITTTPTLHKKSSNIIPYVFQPITHQDILTSILKLKNSVSRTPDAIPSLYIKKTSANLVRPLHFLFNYSMATSTIPTLWKKAIVVPIYKKGKRNDPTNYRPISLTSVLCRLLERIIHNHIFMHMMENQIISEAQHGFMTGRSTQTQQLHFLEKITKMHDEIKQTEIVYLDFSKAFDTVSHKKLLQVLQLYGLDPTITQWIEMYLDHRIQTTIVDNVYSDSVPVTSGVPQGSVLAPLLFIVYTEDLIRSINQACPNTTVYSYADDIKLVSNDPVDLQQALNTVLAWIEKWQLQLNTKKSEHLTIRMKSPITLYIKDEDIPKVNQVRDLGITLSDDLKWSPYINKVRAKANTLSYSILRMFSSNNCWLLLNLFKTYVRPLLEYNTCSWSPYLDYNVTDLENIQKQFTRKICTRCNISFSSYEDRLEKLCLESLQERRIKTDLTFLYKIIHNYVDINFNTFFQINTFSGHNLRRHKFHIERNKIPNSQPLSNFFTYRVIKHWNDLPGDIVNAITLESFKSRLKQWNPVL